MNFVPTLKKHTLQFTFSAGTSRGVLHQKDSWFLLLQANGRWGIGEAGPLAGLSREGTALEAFWPEILKKLMQISVPGSEEEVYSMAAALAGGVASIRFALETALLDWLQGGSRMLFRSAFTDTSAAIPINGLIWMADRATMKSRIDEKLQQGFSCLKLKIGAIDFEEELSLLAYIRSMYSAEELSIRVDANGAFAAREAMRNLQRLAEWELHSIEQPIQPGQITEMRTLCAHSPLPIALDEELIGTTDTVAKIQLLDQLKPPYIILKPSLLGGLAATREWIQLAEERQIGWWITSALEANIGLNAVAQFTATYAPRLPQGLGTGQLYANNIPSPLAVRAGALYYEQDGSWNLSQLHE